MIVNTLERLRLYIEKQPIELNDSIASQHTQNPWFIPRFCAFALQGVHKLICELQTNIENGNIPSSQSQKNVGVIMAGNIPLVGFHDFLSVIASGHNIKIKSSSKDNILFQFLINKMVEWDDSLSDRIQFVEVLKDIDAVIGTGSNNSSRYFEYYFSKYPHIIRRNRTSIALVDETTSKNDLELLADDVFLYFGLGCRNISTLMIPENFEVEKLFPHFEKYAFIADHNKYFNNYDYQKAIAIINQKQCWDNGFCLLENTTENIFSPIGMLYLKRYKTASDITAFYEANKENIQCVVGNVEKQIIPETCPFGQSQFPGIFDFADNVNTFGFLKNL